MLKTTKTAETSGRGKGPILPDFTTAKPKSKATTESKMGPIELYTSSSSKVDSTLPNLVQRPVEPQAITSKWVYGMFGAIATVILATAVLGIYKCYRKTHAINKRQFSSREFEMQTSTVTCSTVFFTTNSLQILLTHLVKIALLALHRHT